MAKKLESTLRNMILSLVLISAVMSAALGYVYVLTKDPIAKSNEKAEQDAIKAVLSDFDNNPATDKKEIDGVTYYPATKGGNPSGCAVKTFTLKGFSGKFTVMVGFLPDGTINKIQVLEQNETPGLGTKMKEPKFMNQFLGKNPANWKMLVKKDGGEVDAISAATITSRAFCDALQRGFDGYMKNFMSKKEEIKVVADTATINVSDTTKIGE